MDAVLKFVIGFVTSALAQLVPSLRVHSRVWVRLLIPLFTSGVAFLFLLWLYAATIGPEVFVAASEKIGTAEDGTLHAIIAMLPIVAILLILSTIWAGVVSLVALCAAEGEPVSSARAIGASARAFPRAVAVATLWLLGVLSAMILTPLFVVGALLALIATPIVVRTSLGDRWPSLKQLLLFAIPLGPAALLAARWGLALQAVWLDGHGVRSALQESWTRVTGRTVSFVWIVLATLGLTVGANALLSKILFAVVTPLYQPWVDFLSLIAVQAVLGPLVVVALTVFYVNKARTRAAVRRPQVAPVKGARTARVATAMVLLFTIQFTFGGAAATAEAVTTRDTEVLVNLASGTPATAGEENTIQVIVWDPFYGEAFPVGDVAISVDGSALAGPFTLDFGGVNVPYTFTAGAHRIDVSFDGDPDFPAGTGELVFTAGYPTTTALVTSVTDTEFGETVTLTATVDTVDGAAPTPTGTVEFTAVPTVGPATGVARDLGTVTLNGAGVATLDVTDLETDWYLGTTHSITAHYLGGGASIESFSTPVEVVSQKTFTTTVFTFVPDTTTDAGVPVTASVTVTSDNGLSTPQGTVKFYPAAGGALLGEGTLVNGSVDVDITLPPGSNAVDANFEADTNFYASSDQQGHTVSPYTSGMVVTSSGATSVVGEEVTFTATITTPAPTVATGSVVFTATPVGGGTAIGLGSHALTGGAASVAVSDLALDDYVVTATYAGSTSVSATDSNELAHSVGQASSTVTVTKAGAGAFFGYRDTVTVTVEAAAPGTGTPTGDIELFWDDATITTQTLIAGSRDIQIDFQAAGAHVVKAVYTGDANFAGNEGTLDVSVSKRGTSVNINVVSPGSGYYGDDETFSGSVVSDAADFASIPTGFVQLIANGTPFANVELNASGGFSLTTDEVAVSAPGGVVDVEQDLQVYYLGDDNHGVSLAGQAGVDTFEVQKRTSQPVLTTNPAEPGVGGTMALVATMENVGFGPRGDVTFYKYEFGIAVEIGTATLTDGVATLTGVPVETGTFQYAAAFTEDLNFFSSVSEIIAVTPTRAAVALDLGISADGAAGVSPYPFGEIITLVAEVTISGALTPTAGVTFSTENGPIVADVPVVGGYAIVQVCAGMTLGDIVGCPVGMPNLGIAPRTITATYPATVENIAGISNGADYDVKGAATTTTLVVNPTSPAVGSAIYFTATVVNDDNDVEPAGYVAFYNSASATEGNTLGYLGRADLVGGIAVFDTQVAAGLYYNATLDDTVQYVHFDTAGIHAEFYGGGTVFATSRDTVGLNVTRSGTSLSTYPASGPALSPTPVTVVLDHDPGYSDDYAGTVTITGDNGRECTATVPAGTSAATCSITWDTVGPHTVSAAYDGDAVYEPSTMTGGAVTITAITSVLNPLINPNVVAGVDTTVAWSTQNPLATGDVEVWGAGMLWCTVDIQVGSCIGQFTNAHSTGTPVDVRVRYYGDAMWTAAEEIVTTTVTGCAQLDVRSNNNALGTVAVDTLSNCGVGGYLIGTRIDVTATVIPPAVFTGWEKYDDTSPYLVPGGQNLATQFTLTNDTSSWVHVATFRNACYALTADATGNGRFYVGTASNCTLPGGGKGFRDGTVVKINAIGAFNKTYGDNDVFYEFSPKLPGAVESRDYFNYPTLTFTMTDDIAVPVIYGPRCRTVTVEFSQATDGDVGSVDSAETCVSPQGTGFVPKDRITVSAASAGANLVLDSWSVNGEVEPTMGRTATSVFTMGYEDTIVTANYVGCYTVDLTLSNARVLWEWAGAATVDLEPNCPDGSERYVEGTELTFTPEILAEAGIFIGWNGEGAASSGTRGIGVHPERAYSLTVTEDATVVAAFYLSEACSTLVVRDYDNLINIQDNGCGEGAYFDYRKQYASVSGEPFSDLWRRRDLTALLVTANEGATNADIYTRVRGDVRDCFNMTGDVPGEFPRDGAFRSGGKLNQRFNECFVGGPITIEVEQCQTMYPSQILFEVAGDTTGGRTNLYSMPQSVFLPDGTGSISKFDVYDFEWLRTYSVQRMTNGSSYASELTDTACADAQYAFPINEPLALEAGSYSQGITFKGFSDLNAQDFLPLNPLMVELDGAQKQIEMSVRFEVKCHTVILQEGISISDPAVGHCPNGAPNSYIEGTGFQVTAVNSIGGRISNGFKGGVLTGSVTQDPVTLDQTGLVYVDGPKTVKSDYPTSGERIERGIVQGLKISAGVAAIAVVAIGTTLFPWVGVFLAGLAISAAVSSIIPGGEDVSAFFDLINPTKLTTCASQWAFGKTGGGKTEVGPGSSVKVASTSYKVYKLVNAADAAAEAAAAAAKAGEDALNAALAAGQTVGQAESASAAAIAAASKPGWTSTATKVGGNVLKVAGFGYELYSNGIGEIDPAANTTDELRDTAGMTECLDNAWRFAGSNTSGN